MRPKYERREIRFQEIFLTRHEIGTELRPEEVWDVNGRHETHWQRSQGTFSVFK